MSNEITGDSKSLNPIFEKEWLEEWGEEGLNLAHMIYPNYDASIILVNNVPDEMKKIDCWLIWGFESRDGKKSKVPRNLSGAKEDPKTIRRSFAEVINSYGQYYLRSYRYPPAGVGFLIEPPFIFFDYDDALDENGNIIDPNIQKEVELLHSYTEVSPSGTGLHVIATGNTEGLKSARTEKKEIYFNGRYATVTGNIWKNDEKYSKLRNIEDETLHAVYDPLVKQKIAPKTLENQTVNKNVNKITSTECGGVKSDVIETDGSDDDIIEHLLNYEFYSGKLFNGNYESITTDHSKADMLLCCQIKKYTRDPNQIDSIFRRSGLMRSKWDEMRGDSTYGEITIRKVINY